MADRVSPPTTELGGTSQIAIRTGGPLGGAWGQFIQQGEHVPDLRWPVSNQWYERMLYTDAQIEALYVSTFLPITDYVWAIDPNGADAGAAAALAADLGLPLGLPDSDDEYEIQPGVGRFDFVEHQTEALLAMPFGHYMFEIVMDASAGDGIAHLAKLAPRAPATIWEIDQTPGGDLAAIRQYMVTPSGARDNRFSSSLPPWIPGDRLVPYVWRSDARARWIGRPMLRSAYRHWLVKDILIRVDAINHERAGGVPHVETDHTYQGGDLTALAQHAQNFKVGEYAGGALPPGAKLVLDRVPGTDVVASIRYHDEQLSRQWQAMIMQLGQTQTGSRALGQTFADLQQLAQRAVANWFRNRFREHFIERWWGYNVGQPEPGSAPKHPLLVFRPRHQQGTTLVQPGAPGAQQVGNQSPGPAQEENAPPGQAQVQAGRGFPTRAASGPQSTLSATGISQLTTPVPRLPPRKLRRQPTEVEIRAATDFAALETSYLDAATTVQQLFRDQMLPQQIAGLRDAITHTKAGEERKRVTAADMSKLRAPVVGLDELNAALLSAARSGALTAHSELATQGMAAEIPTDEALALRVADHAAAVAQQTADGLSIAASRKAVQLAPTGSPPEVAAGVGEYIAGLKHQWEADQLDGAVQQAQNAGRFEVFGQVEKDVRFYASELLDVNTCTPCAGVDGQEYGTLGDAEQDYPSGGFVDCAGGPRCRGTLVAVAGENVQTFE